MSGNELFKKMKEDIIAHYLSLGDSAKKDKFWLSCQQTAIDLETKYQIDLLETFKQSEDAQANYFVDLLEKENNLEDRKKLGKALFKVIFLAEIFRRVDRSKSQEPQISENTQEIVSNQLEQVTGIVEEQTLTLIETLDHTQEVQTPLRDILVEFVFNAVIDAGLDQTWQGLVHPLFMYLVPTLKQKANYPDMPSAFLLGVDEYLESIKDLYPNELQSRLFEENQQASYFSASTSSIIKNVSTQILEDLKKIAQYFENTFLDSYASRKTDIFENDTYVKAILLGIDGQGQATYTQFLKKLGSFLAAREDLSRFNKKLEDIQQVNLGNSEQTDISETINIVNEAQQIATQEVLAEISRTPITTLAPIGQTIDTTLLDYKASFQYYFMDLTSIPTHFGLFFYHTADAKTPFSGLILPLENFGVSDWQDFKNILEKSSIIPNYVVATALETPITTQGNKKLGDFLVAEFQYLSELSLLNSIRYLHKAIFGDESDLISIDTQLSIDLGNLQIQGQILAIYETILLEQISLEKISTVVRSNPRAFENLTVQTFVYQNRIYFYDRHLNYRLLVVSNPLSHIAINTEQYPQTLEINIDQSLSPIKILTSTCEDKPFVQEFLQGLSSQNIDAMPNSPTLQRLQANVLGHLVNSKLRIKLTNTTIDKILNKLDSAKQKALKFFENAEYLQKGYLSTTYDDMIEDATQIKTKVLQYYKEQLYVQTTFDQRGSLRFIVFSKIEKAGATIPRIHLSFEVVVEKDTFNELFPLKTSFTPSTDYLFDLEHPNLLQDQAAFNATFRLSDLVIALQSLGENENAHIDFSTMLIGIPNTLTYSRTLETIGFLKFQTKQISIFIESHLENEIPYIDLDADQ